MWKFGICDLIIGIELIKSWALISQLIVSLYGNLMSSEHTQNCIARLKVLFAPVIVKVTT